MTVDERDAILQSVDWMGRLLAQRVEAGGRNTALLTHQHLQEISCCLAEIRQIVRAELPGIEITEI